MKEKRDYRYSLFGRFIGLTFLIFLSLVFVITWQIQGLRQNLIHVNLSDLTFNIKHSIKSNIHDTENRLRFLASSLSDKEKELDFNSLVNLFKWLSIDYTEIMVYWTPITWLNEEDSFVYDNAQFIKIPVNHEYKNYINSIGTKPFALQFAKESRAFSENDEVILPAVMRVEDKNGEHLGDLVTGLYLNKLKESINKQINQRHKKIYYALIDTTDNKVILNSDDFNKNDTTIFNDLASFIANEGENTVSYTDKYKNYVMSKISNYPFALVIGTNPLKLSYEDYLQNILPYKYQLLLLVITLCSLIYLFYNSILNPFLLLSKAALEISKGDINTEIPKIHNKEGAAVANALEKIRDSLRVERSLIQEISQTHNLLSLTNLRLENQVLERTKELETALSGKTSFLNNLSHEIKTPLQAVTNIAESLAAYWEEFSEEKRLELVHQILHGSQSLLSLLRNLLELANFTESKIILNIENIDLVGLTKEIIEECKILHFNNKQLNFNIVNDKAIYILADKNRIKQVLRNLIVNAIRFSPYKGHVAINIIPTKITIDNGSRHDAIHFAIHDQGVGIPEEELINIFSPFVQGSNVKNRSTGTGLGLAICKDIINIHHGKIWAVNNKDGGATFNFIIPVTQPVNIATYTPSSISLNKIEPNILVVDDEEVCLNSMEMLLYGSRYNLIKIKSAHFALKYLKEHGNMISIIFIDLMMPDMYGLNFIAEIKNDPDLNSIPIILQTSSSDEEELVKAVDIGVFSLIRKPYNKKALLYEIEKAMHFNKLNKELH